MVAVFLGNGDGSFDDGQDFQVSALPASLATGNFNDDNLVDLVLVGGSPTGSIELLIGVGDGTFQTAGIFNAPNVQNPSSIAVRDVNADNADDVVITGIGSDNVAVFLSTNDGTFEEPSSYYIGVDPQDIRVADFDGDGLQDVITANSVGGGLSVLFGNGDGSFDAAKQFLAGDAHHSSCSVSVSDLNQDGIPDIVTADEQDDEIVVLIGIGNGTFANRLNFDTGNRPRCLAVADMNNDGVVDVATNSSQTNENFALLLGNGDGTFQQPQFSNFSNRPTAFIACDFDGDGANDIAAISIPSGSSSGFVSVLLGNGDGTLGTEQVYEIVNVRPTAVAVGDFNTDGFKDLLTANNDSTLSLLIGIGDGTFVLPTTISVKGGNGNGRRFGVGDLNGDGVDDVVLPAPTRVFLGQGNGEFLAGQQFDNNYHHSFASLSDLNDDGVLDIFSTGSGSVGIEELVVFIGTGDGTFGAPKIFGAGKTPVYAAAADFNCDGENDIVVANRSDFVHVLLNQ